MSLPNCMTVLIFRLVAPAVGEARSKPSNQISGRMKDTMMRARNFRFPVENEITVFGCAPTRRYISKTYQGQGIELRFVCHVGFKCKISSPK
jgi:hypothetical protein